MSWKDASLDTAIKIVGALAVCVLSLLMLAIGDAPLWAFGLWLMLSYLVTP